MDIKTLIKNLKAQDLPKGEFAVFGSAVMAVRGIREAPNIDVIVTDKLWGELLRSNSPDEEGFIRLPGQVKVSNWWFAPTRKPLTKLIEESEEINGLPYVKLEEVLDYKKGLNREKDNKDIELIEKHLSGPSNLGMETYQKFVDRYLKEVDKKLGNKIFSLVIFGSIGRSQAKGESDIDMFTFYEDEQIARAQVNDILIDIIIKLRKSKEYKELADKNIFPEVYPFLISRSKSKELLAVFLDSSDHGIILKDDGTVKKLMDKIIKNKTQRVVLPNGKWVWINI